MNIYTFIDPFYPYHPVRCVTVSVRVGTGKRWRWRARKDAGSVDGKIAEDSGKEAKYDWKRCAKESGQGNIRNLQSRAFGWQREIREEESF